MVRVSLEGSTILERSYSNHSMGNQRSFKLDRYAFSILYIYSWIPWPATLAVGIRIPTSLSSDIPLRSRRAQWVRSSPAGSDIAFNQFPSPDMFVLGSQEIVPLTVEQVYLQTNYTVEYVEHHLFCIRPIYNSENFSMSHWTYQVRSIEVSRLTLRLTIWWRAASVAYMLNPHAFECQVSQTF